MPLTMAEIGKVSVINRVNGNEETRRFSEILVLWQERKLLYYPRWAET